MHPTSRPSRSHVLIPRSFFIHSLLEHCFPSATIPRHLPCALCSPENFTDIKAEISGVAFIGGSIFSVKCKELMTFIPILVFFICLFATRLFDVYIGCLFVALIFVGVSVNIYDKNSQEHNAAPRKGNKMSGFNSTNFSHPP